jgi:glycosyltransferase involved in cell wall biosynthesis
MLQRWRARHHRHDVVFYAPWVGSMLSSRESLPAGGAETQVLMLARGLARAGLRVAIVAYGDNGELPSSVNGVTIAPCGGYRKPRGAVPKVRGVLRIWRSLHRAPAQTIICRTATYELGLIAIYARLARRRLTFACPNVIAFDYRKLEPMRARRVMYNLGVRLAHTIVVQTEEQVALCESTLRRRPVLIRSIAAPAPQQDAAPAAFLWVGRLIWYKRPLEYIALARALPEARFWMVGVPAPIRDGGAAVLAASIAVESKDVPNLEVLGPRSHSELGGLMARAVASVNTCEFEGMPNVLLEGWSRGVPALVLNHDPSGVVEEHGLGDFAHGSSERLVELARRQWNSRNQREALSEECRRYIQTYHDPQRVTEQWLRVVRNTPCPRSRIVDGREPEAECAA